MKSGRCPKCGSSRIAKTQYTIYLGQGLSGPTLDLFACADCRLVEQYLQDDVEARVAVLDSWKWVNKNDGPFRGQGSRKG